MLALRRLIPGQPSMVVLTAFGTLLLGLLLLSKDADAPVLKSRHLTLLDLLHPRDLAKFKSDYLRLGS